jgi:hypothetical protein
MLQGIHAESELDNSRWTQEDKKTEVTQCVIDEEVGSFFSFHVSVRL